MRLSTLLFAALAGAAAASACANPEALFFDRPINIGGGHQTFLNLLFFDLLLNLRRDVDDIAEPSGFFDQLFRVDFHGMVGLRMISKTLLKASSTLEGSLPPAWAKSARPPPPPPTIGATSLMMFPA